MNRFLILALMALFILPGCGDKNEEVKLPGDSEVLATVNGSVISRFDLDLSIETMMGREEAEKIDAAGRGKVLESLVMSRAISQARAQVAPADDLAVINRKAAAYREKLLVRQYLAKNAPPQPVTREMIRDYYLNHLDEFGAKKERVYEMISSKRPLKAEERNALLEKLRKPEEKRDWRKWVEELQKQGYPLAYRRGAVVEKILHPQLRKMLESLKKNEPSPLTFIKDICYLVKIVEEKDQPARPLKEVSGQIRKMLVPVQLKKSIEQVSREVLEKAEVEYR
ncbi:MAG: peptidylprolyl isomerase [Desulfurivibrionaceae bacterium]